MRSLGGLQFPVSRRIHSSLGCDNIKMLISIEELRRNPFQVSLCICDNINISVTLYQSNCLTHLR